MTTTQSLSEPCHKESAQDKVAILIDMLSFPYLQGATIDYKNDANGERFVITNPNAKSTCGCGSSFDA